MGDIRQDLGSQAADTRFDAALALLAQGDRAAALSEFERMRRLNPECCRAALGLGSALLTLNEPERAIATLQDALALMPGDPLQVLALVRTFSPYLPMKLLDGLLGAAVGMAWNDSAALLRVADFAYLGRFGDTAVKALQRLHELDPGNGKVLPTLVDARLSVCDWGDGDVLARDVMAAADQRMAAGRPLDIDVWNLFAIGVDYPTLARAARYKSAQIEAEVALSRSVCNFQFGPPQSDRIRLGYLCPYTNKSSHTENLWTVVSRHDRERFELFGYSISQDSGDSFEHEFKACFDAFRHTPLNRLEESARRIRDDGIDILIDSTGHFAASCMQIAALRPAPVVVHGAAGFNIIGAADFYDYSLNDRMFLDDDLARLYPEKPFYMPHSAMPAERLPIADEALDRSSFGIPEGVFVFADFNHPCKFDPKCYDAWLRILRSVPDSVLLLGMWIGDTATRLHHLAAAEGIDPARIMFMPIEPRDRHLRRLQLCDLALDTYYHCGGVTTVDCLMAGLPILSALPDRALPLANRSLLAAMDLHDMVVADLESYVDRAIALARTPEELAAIRTRMRKAHADAPLFQAQRWVRNLERSYAIIHQRRLDGDEPAPFSVLDVDAWPA